MSELVRKKIIFAEDLWVEIDELSTAIELAGDSDLARGNSSYAMLLLGRKEMLNLIVDWLADNETVLDEVLQKHGYDIK